MAQIRTFDRQPDSSLVKTCLALWLGLCCAVAQAADIAPEAATGREGHKTATAKQWMAVTANPHATETAAAILAEGGTAIDAAIAAQMVLGLVEPQSSGIGGGAFLLYWQADKRKLHYYDGRETAPAALKPDHFIVDGQPMDFFDAVVGGHAVGVPGLVHMLDKAHNKHGKKPWGELLQPAIALARDGFAVSGRLHGLLARTAQHEPTMQQTAFRDYFYRDGKPLPVGYRLKNPAYADTLQLVADKGATAFYQGDIARDIADAVQSNTLRQGLLTYDDIKNYQSKERQPLCKQVTAFILCGANAPTSGPITVMQTVALLQYLPDMKKIAYDSPDFYHRYVEALKLAMADRNQYLADPDFVDMPIEAMLDDAYLKKRAAMIPLKKAGDKNPPAGVFEDFSDLQAGINPERPSTSHLSIVDKYGNIVSMTSSIEMAFGSRIMVGGFLLNNQLTDFSFVAQKDGRKVANRVAPGKRPRSSMAPMIVFDKNNNPKIAIGSPGGSRIISYVAKTLAQAVYNGTDMLIAVESPHASIYKGTVYMEDNPAGRQIKESLEKIGHTANVTDQTSGLHVIVLDGDGGYRGIADSRREGAVQGR